MMPTDTLPRDTNLHTQAPDGDVVPPAPVDEAARDLVAAFALLADSSRRDTVWCFECRMRGARCPGTVLLELRVGEMRWFSRVSCEADVARQRADMLSPKCAPHGGASVREKPFAPGLLIARVFARLGLDALPRETPVGPFEVVVDPPGGVLRLRAPRAAR